MFRGDGWIDGGQVNIANGQYSIQLVYLSPDMLPGIQIGINKFHFNVTYYHHIIVPIIL
jgi:hypothetical protein